MKKLFLFTICAILPAIAFPQYLSKDFTIDDFEGTTSIALNVSVSNADSLIILSNTSTASGMFVSGCANLSNDDDSYVRITLKDTDSNEYLVYELYPLLAESRQSPFSKIGLESAYLDNIHPQSIRIETLNASVVLDSVFFVVPERSSRNMLKAIPNRKSQCEHIACRLNDRLISSNKTWRAGVTFVSQMTFEEKRGMFGKEIPVLYGFDYYKSGIFVMPGYNLTVPRVNNTRVSDNYVTEWDWRNRHGKNWVTSVKAQGGCGACSAFSALGTFESYINLYYNQLLNYDLSEQDLITNGPVDCEEGANMPDVLNRIISLGVVPEECFHYSGTNGYIYNKCQEPSDILSFVSCSNDYYDSYKDSPSESYTIEEDSIKRMLFRSPICFGIHSWLHFVVLVGYKQIQSGENYFTFDHNHDTIPILPENPLVGHPAWLIKNSIGTDWGQGGFGYVAMSLSNAYGIYKLTGGVNSHVLVDNVDIVCEDADGDGYYNWGIKDTIFSRPIWAPMEEDGDDSDCTKGPIDDFGNLRIIDPNLLDTIFIDNNTEYNNPLYIHQHILVYEGWDFTISNHVYCCPGVSITLERGATLYLEGEGMLENVILKAQPGSHIVIEDGCCIKHNKAVNFKIPLGVTLEGNHGIIE